MRKLLSLILAAFIAAASVCAAEEPVFVLENGLRWNMTAGEALDALGVEDAYSEPFYYGVDMVQYTLDTDLPDEDCSVTLSMVFVDGGLAMIMYDFLRADDPLLKQDCINSLTALYGEPIEGGGDRFMASFGLLAGMPDMRFEDVGANGGGVSWELADGTYIGVYDMTDISFGVYFVNEPKFAKVADYAAAAFGVTPDGLPEPSGNDFSVAEFALSAPGYMGMDTDTLTNVAGLDGYKYYEYETGDNATLYKTLVYPSGDYDVHYGFHNGALTVQSVNALLFEPRDIAALLTGIYGAPVSVDDDALFSILSESGFNTYASPEEMAAAGFTGKTAWQLPGGTYIVLSQNDTFDSFSLYFIKPVKALDTAAELTAFAALIPGIWEVPIEDIHAEKKLEGFTCSTTDRDGAVSLYAYRQLPDGTLYHGYNVYPRGFVGVYIGFETSYDSAAPAAEVLASLYGEKVVPTEGEAFVIEAVTGMDNGAAAEAWRTPDGGLAVLTTDGPGMARIDFINPEHLPPE